jgi:hypothetical protein
VTAFQGSGFVEIGESIARLSGVRSVWLHKFSEHHAGMWVLVGGSDDSAWFTRRRVHGELLKYERVHRQALDAAGFVFERYIFTDQEESETPSIPQGARQITPYMISAS